MSCDYWNCELKVPVYWPPYPMHYGICANRLLKKTAESWLYRIKAFNTYLGLASCISYLLHFSYVFRLVFPSNALNLIFLYSSGLKGNIYQASIRKRKTKTHLVSISFCPWANNFVGCKCPPPRFNFYLCAQLYNDIESSKIHIDITANLNQTHSNDRQPFPAAIIL